MMYWLMIGVALFGVAVSAQYTEIPAKSGPASLVFPGSGVPVVLEQIEERSRKLDGGALEVEAIKSKVYRNSSGKLRIDSDESDVNSGRVAQTISHIIDPSTGVRVILLSAAKSGYRVVGPKVGESGFADGFAGIGESLPSSRLWTTKTEKLGNRVIDGVEFEGTRIIQTAQGEPVITNTIERWYSNELNLVGLAVASGPAGTHTARIQNLRREEPDPSLFTVSAEYKILDVLSPSLDPPR